MKKFTLLLRVLAITNLVLCILVTIYKSNVILRFAFEFGMGVCCILNGVFLPKMTDKCKNSDVLFIIVAGILIILITLFRFINK